AMSALDPWSRELIASRFFRKVELRIIAAQHKTTPPTMSRRIRDALRDLAYALRRMGVAGIDELTLAEHFGDPTNVPELAGDAIDGLRFAPDWRALAGAFAAGSALHKPAKPLRVGVFVSYRHVMTMGIDDKHGSIHAQTRSSMLMTDPDIQ